MKGKEIEVLSLRLPSDAHTYGDELYNRAKESIEQKSILPILKNELKYKIQNRRLSQGLDELKVDFKPKPSSPPTEEEIAKQNSRKLNNRLSAKRCRLKKKKVHVSMKEELLKLKTKNQQLLETIRQLENEKEYYISNILNNPSFVTVLSEVLASSTNNQSDKVLEQALTSSDYVMKCL